MYDYDNPVLDMPYSYDSRSHPRITGYDSKDDLPLVMLLHTHTVSQTMTIVVRPADIACLILMCNWASLLDTGHMVVVVVFDWDMHYYYHAPKRSPKNKQ